MAAEKVRLGYGLNVSMHFRLFGGDNRNMFRILAFYDSADLLDKVCIQTVRRIHRKSVKASPA